MILQIEGFGTSALQTFGAFGFLVVFMFIVIVQMYYELKASRKRNEELSEKTIELVTKVAEKIPGLDSIAEMKMNQGTVIKNQIDIIAAIQRIIDKL